MRTADPIARTCALFIPITLGAMLAMQCAGNGSGKSADGASEKNVDKPADTLATATDVRAKGMSMTPAEERRTAMGDLRGLRATLVDELKVVRDRLSEGTDPQKDADLARAAGLAQGLERIDRSMTASDDATDATWSSIRDAQMKQAEDVRSWIRQYRSDNATAKK